MDSAPQLLRVKTPAVPVLRSLIFFLGALTLPAAFAAQPVAPASASATSGEALGLKLDLGLALGEDDCEGDYADLVTVVPTSGSSGEVQAASNPGEAMLAKLTPLEAFNASGTADAMPVAAVSSASTAQAAPVQVATVAAPTPVPETAPAPAAAPATMPGVAWEIIPSDKTLNAALARWASLAGWQLLWELPVDYSVDARTTIRGSFEEAVAMVAKSMDGAEIPMKAIFYEGNRVLRIVARGAE